MSSAPAPLVQINFKAEAGVERCTSCAINYEPFSSPSSSMQKTDWTRRKFQLSQFLRQLLLLQIMMKWRKNKTLNTTSTIHFCQSFAKFSISTFCLESYTCGVLSNRFSISWKLKCLSLHDKLPLILQLA